MDVCSLVPNGEIGGASIKSLRVEPWPPQANTLVEV